jgi:hypothetical protein
MNIKQAGGNLSLLFNPEDGGYIFRRNVRELSVQEGIPIHDYELTPWS